MKKGVGDKKWYLIRTNSKAEKKCCESLQLKGFEVYLPLQKVQRKWSDRIKTIEEPIFKGYLFVFTNVNERYEILNTPNVFQFVHFNGELAVVSKEEIKGLKNALSKDISIEIIEEQIEVGEEVIITSGPFSGLFAKLVGVKNKYKLQIAIEAIGKAILIEIGRTKVEKVIPKNTI